MSKERLRQLEAERVRMEKKYGNKSAALGSATYKLNVVPTGILSLDYALGTGGWPLGHPVEIFGAPDIGKSSVLGLGALRNAQAMGLTCGIVALEPGFDKEWAIKNGVDPEWLIIGRPDDGQAAFEMLFDWVNGDLVDFILFDSIGALLRPSEVDAEKGKPNQGGQSGLITWGVKRILMKTWKNNKGLIFLNQQRDDMDSRIPGMVESPGGWALKHSAAVRVHLKKGKDRDTVTEGTGDDQEVIVVGQQLVAAIKRNKLSEGTNRKATFWYYQKETRDSPIGIDVATDVLATALRTGVIKKAGGYYRHPGFPEAKSGKNQLQGKDALGPFLDENPKVAEQIREEVLAVMLKKAGPPKEIEPEDPEEVTGDED